MLVVLKLLRTWAVAVDTPAFSGGTYTHTEHGNMERWVGCLKANLLVMTLTVPVGEHSPEVPCVLSYNCW